MQPNLLLIRGGCCQSKSVAISLADAINVPIAMSRLRREKVRSKNGSITWNYG